MTLRLDTRPLPGCGFGAVTRLASGEPTAAAVQALEAEPAALADAFYRAGGLLLIEGLHGIVDEPALLLRLSRLLGPEVEDYRPTHTRRGMIHPEVPQI